MAHLDAAPLAQLGPVSDDMLLKLRDIAYAATRGELTALEAEFLLIAAGPLFDELILRRNVAAATLAGAVQGGQVILLSDHR